MMTDDILLDEAVASEMSKKLDTSNDDVDMVSEKINLAKRNDFYGFCLFRIKRFIFSQY